MAVNDVNYRADAVLRNGGSLQIRALRADDKPLLLLFCRRFCQRSAYFKFFRTRQGVSEGDIAQFIEVDCRMRIGRPQ